MTEYAYNADYLSHLTGRWNKISFPMISGLLSAALRYEHRRILDFGCGAGTYAEVLAALGGEVRACDISDDSVAVCRGKYAETFIVYPPTRSISFFDRGA